MKVVGFYFLVSGVLAVLVILLIILRWYGEFNWFFLCCGIYFISICFLSFFFGYQFVVGNGGKHVFGALVLATLSVFSFEILGFSYSVVLGVGVIFEISKYSDWVFGLKFPMAEFAISYSKVSSGFSVGLNFVALAVSNFLFREFKRNKITG